MPTVMGARVLLRRVTRDGRPASGQDAPMGRSLPGVRAFIEPPGGRFAMEFRPGRGTTLRLRVPPH